MARAEPESVWDYPRPPRIEPEGRRVRVELGGETIADTTRALRVLETASPPTVYIPREDVREELLADAPGHHTHCEWKGGASYLHAEAGGARAEHAAWFYPEPRPDYAELAGPRRLRRRAGSTPPTSTTSRSARRAAASTEAGSPTRSRGPYKGEPGTEGW